MSKKNINVMTYAKTNLKKGVSGTGPMEKGTKRGTGE